MNGRQPADLTGKKEVGRAMSNCIEKVVRRTFGRDHIHWLEILEASLSTSKYWENILTYFDHSGIIEFTLKKISDTMIRLNGSAIENPWNRKLRKTKLHLKYCNIIISMKYCHAIMWLDYMWWSHHNMASQCSARCQMSRMLTLHTTHFPRWEQCEVMQSVNL